MAAIPALQAVNITSLVAATVTKGVEASCTRAAHHHQEEGGVGVEADGTAVMPAAVIRPSGAVSTKEAEEYASLRNSSTIGNVPVFHT